MMALGGDRLRLFNGSADHCLDWWHSGVSEGSLGRSKSSVVITGPIRSRDWVKQKPGGCDPPGSMVKVLCEAAYPQTAIGRPRHPTMLP
jgi:hypothetical protein